MRAFHTTLLALLLCTGTSAIAEPFTLEFDWPVPSSVEVTETAIEEGKMDVYRYRVHLRRDDESLILEHSDIKLLLEGGNPPTASAAARLENRMRVLRPPIRLDNAGDFIDFVNPEMFDPSDGTRQMVSKLLGDVADMDDIRALAELRAIEYWLLWVLNWTETPYELGNPTVEADVAPFFSQEVEARFETTVSRPLPGQITLVGRKFVDKDEVANSIRSFAFGMLKAIGKETVEGKAALDSLQFIDYATRATVTMIEATMQPLSMTTDLTMQIRVQGTQETVRERISYEFDWGDALPGRR